MSQKGEPLARHVLWVLGPAWTAREVGAVVGSLEHALVEEAPAEVMAAFASDGADTEGVASALRVESRGFGAAGAIMTSRAVLAVGARLLMAGGIAMRSGSGDVGHPKARWLELEQTARRGAKGEVEGAIVEAFVGRVKVEWEREGESVGESVGTCGMHMVGRAEVVVRGAGAGAGAGDEIARVVEGVMAGGVTAAVPETITVGPTVYRVQNTRTSRYAEGDPRWNPWGEWEMERVAGEAPRP